MPYLALNNITVQYKGFRALDNVSISVPKGELFGLIGPNGSGKTTVLKAIAGLVKTRSGEITLEGGRIDPAMKDFRKRIGYVPQENSFFMQLTIKENLKYFAHMYGIRGNLNAIAANVVHALGLSEKINERADRLSGGMRRRLNIGCALMHNPEILLLDEPTIELDPQTRAGIWRLIKYINKQGTTVIVSTNVLEEASRLCYRLAYLTSGKVAYMGDATRIIKAMRQEGW